MKSFCLINPYSKHYLTTRNMIKKNHSEKIQRRKQKFIYKGYIKHKSLPIKKKRGVWLNSTMEQTNGMLHKWIIALLNKMSNS